MGKIVQNTVGFFFGAVKSYFTSSAKTSNNAVVIEDVSEQHALSNELIDLERQTGELLKEVLASSHKEQHNWLIYSLEDLLDEARDTIRVVQKGTEVLTRDDVVDFKERLDALVHDYDFVFSSSPVIAPTVSTTSTTTSLPPRLLVPQLSKPYHFLQQPQQQQQQPLRLSASSISQPTIPQIVRT